MNKNLKAIIDNFSQQLALYKKMTEFSRQQLRLLGKEDIMQETGDINSILKKRQELLFDIGRLNEKNKLLQEGLKNELGIEEFVLSHLEKKIAEESFVELKILITELGKELLLINENDTKSQSLMKKGYGSNGRKTRSGSQEASNAYKKAMEQKYQGDE